MRDKTFGQNLKRIWIKITDNSKQGNEGNLKWANWTIFFRYRRIETEKSLIFRILSPKKKAHLRICSNANSKTSFQQHYTSLKTSPTNWKWPQFGALWRQVGRCPKKELFHFEVITLKSCDGGKLDKSRWHRPEIGANSAEKRKITTAEKNKKFQPNQF